MCFVDIVNQPLQIELSRVFSFPFAMASFSSHLTADSEFVFVPELRGSCNFLSFLFNQDNECSYVMK